MSITSEQLLAKNLNLTVVLGFVISFLYVAPIFLISFTILMTDGLKENSTLFVWFATFMNSADSTLNQFHKILFPILAGLSAVALRDKPSGGVIALGCFLLVALVITIAVSVYFDIPTVAKSVEGLEGELNPALAKAFFAKVQETLLTYFALLFGLSVASAKREDNQN